MTETVKTIPSENSPVASEPLRFRIRRPAGAAAGRHQKVKSNGEPVATCCVVARVTREQRDFFRDAGGARWVRDVISRCLEKVEATQGEIS